MSRSPFIEDPRQKASEHIAKAVASPVEEVRAIHIRAAEQLTELARANGLQPRIVSPVKAPSKQER